MRIVGAPYHTRDRAEVRRDPISHPAGAIQHPR